MAKLQKWETEDKEAERKSTDAIIARIEELDGDTPGMILAQDIIEAVLSQYGPGIYDKAVRDVRTLLDGRFEDVLMDVDLLQH